MVSPGDLLHRIRALTWLALALALLVPALAPAGAVARQLPGAELYASVLPAYRESFRDNTQARLPRYEVDATLSPAGEGTPVTIDGTLDLRYVNETAAEQAAIYLRLYPNGEEYGDGAMAIDAVRIDGAAASPHLSVNDTLATIPLALPLAPDASLDLRLEFQTIVPTNPRQSYGMFAYDVASRTIALAHWLPLLAGHDADGNWELGPLSVNGDPVFSNTALFDVTLDAPSDFTVVTTGVQVAASTTGAMTRGHFVSGPARDFVMAADASLESTTTTVEGTTIRSWYNPGSADGGAAVLDQAAGALRIFNRLLGPYPYSELDLVQVDLGNGAGGVEFPQLIFVGSDYYGPSATTSAIPGFLEFIVVHEVAHQWWYSLVGNDQYVHAFMDEALANTLTVIYFRERYGDSAYQQQVDINLTLPYLTMLFSQGDQIVDQPTDAFPNMNVYASTVYGKGAIGFDELRKLIGDEAFFAALKDYAHQYRFGVANPAQLRTAFEQQSGQDLQEFWRHWFEAAEGTEDYSRRDYAELLVRLGR